MNLNEPGNVQGMQVNRLLDRIGYHLGISIQEFIFRNVDLLLVI